MNRVAIAAAALLAGVAGSTADGDGDRATLSNVALPVDTSGAPLLTGEADVLHHDGAWYLYMNDWGGCAGVDCCDTEGGCGSCCFVPPTEQYPDATAPRRCCTRVTVRSSQQSPAIRAQR